MRSTMKTLLTLPILTATLAACGAATSNEAFPRNSAAVPKASAASAAGPNAAPVVNVSATAVVTPRPRPRIEVCFVLDTTGSMSSLIEGAKQKIWAIANDMIRADPRPEIKIALLPYRDKGDKYVTQVFDLSDDIDAVYGHLKEFTADGGGDEAESVNQALAEAVNNVAWSQDKGVYKVIFLVGDAPPHMDYANDVKYAETCQAAVRKDLVINTVQCGTIAATGPIWQAIAHLSEGSYVAIGQTGDMTVVATPMDARLTELTHEISATAVVYGGSDRRAEVHSKLAAAATAPASSAADRMSYMGKAGSAIGGAAGPAPVVSGAGELIQDLANKRVNLEDLKESELPAEMQKLDAAGRKDYVAKQVARRQEIQSQIDDLAKKRQTYLDEQRARTVSEGKATGFDDQVTRMIHEQGRRKGIQFELPGTATQPAQP